jgi:ribosomal protein S18 acetylase RimI-like enzyme
VETQLENTLRKKILKFYSKHAYLNLTLKRDNLQIENCTPGDIDEIFRLYRIASDYQRSKKTVVVWPEFERELIENEIAENRQWKLIIDNKIACVWATTFSDEQIWEERNADAAVYIHRIATNPDFRGKNFVSIIVEWVKEYAKKQGKDFVRLDTLGNNVKLIDYYKNAGFNFLGMFDLKDTSGLPAHYHNVPACLFEIQLD